VSDPILDILMITHNRPDYTAMSLRQLLGTCESGMRVWVWHNGDDADTRRVIATFSGHPRLGRVLLSEENRRLREPTNWFWQNAEAPFLSKVDDDCLLPAGWANTLTAAHRGCEQLGVLGCWRFYEQDFIPKLALPKIRDLPDGHRMMLNCWVQGSGYVMKRSVIAQLGLLRATESFTDYCVRAAAAGWINGWYFPFIHEEHMDDPRSAYSVFTSDEDFVRNRPLSAIKDDVRSLEEWKNRVHWMARSVQAAPYDPRQYIGWRAKARVSAYRIKRACGWREPWRLA
jgi:hypothetical protein